MKRLAWLWILLLALLMLGGAGCGCGDDDDDDDSAPPADDDDDTADDDDATDDDAADDDDDDDDDNDDDAVPECDWETHDPLIVAGKEHLENSEIYEAYEAFDDAWDLCPDSIDARFGIALTNQLELERQIYALLEYALTNPLTPKGGSDKGFGSLMQSLIMHYWLPKADEMLMHAESVRAAPANWSFYIETYPFVVEGQFEDTVIMDLGGEWDHGDAIQLEAEAQFYRGLFFTLCAYDLTMDYGWLTGFPDLTGTLVEQIHTIATWFLTVLNDPLYESSFTLLDDVGAERIHNAGLAFGSFFVLMNEASEVMLLETDDQEDDLTGYHDRNGNFQWDEGEPYKLPYVGYLTDDQNGLWVRLVALFLQMGYSTWNGGELDVHPNRPDWVWLSEFSFLLRMIGLDWWLPPIPMDLGGMFYDQGDSDLKDTLRTVAMLIYVLTQP